MQMIPAQDIYVRTRIRSVSIANNLQNKYKLQFLSKKKKEYFDKSEL